jgi:hypothetical protein
VLWQVLLVWPALQLQRELHQLHAWYWCMQGPCLAPQPHTTRPHGVTGNHRHWRHMQF